MNWRSWSADPPEAGTKIVLVADDGMSAALALVVLNDENSPGVSALDAEDGQEFWEGYYRGALWTPLPEDYPLSFMEAIPDN